MVLKILFLLICSTVLILLNRINNEINSYFYRISSIQASKISKSIINEAINKNILEYINTQELFIVHKKDNGDISSIDYNVAQINKILLLINSNVKNYLKELENGESSIIDLKKSLVTNNYISKKPGVFLEIPLGVFLNNIFLVNISPKIPVKLSLNGEVLSRIKTEVENYGINNSIIKVFVEIEVTEQIILPSLSRNIVVQNKIPIAIKMIQGGIPNYYLGNISQNQLYSW